jgi:hypothetical protein
MHVTQRCRGQGEVLKDSTGKYLRKSYAFGRPLLLIPAPLPPTPKFGLRPRDEESSVVKHESVFSTRNPLIPSSFRYTVNGAIGGTFKTVDNLTWLRVFASGHQIPYFVSLEA